ncbi:MAG TPA: choice-of-anchor X domain-containing protein [archaeon]|nr:choice-of-anchor X domain-containing protein [archaeon]
MRKVFALALVLIFSASAFGAESVYWFRGNDFTTFIEGKTANFMTTTIPNISSSETAFEPDSENVLGTWYSSTFANGTQLYTSIIFWTNGFTGEKISWELYEFTPLTLENTLLASGETENNAESKVMLSNAVNVKPGSRLKVVLKSENGKLEIDGTELSANSSWTSPSGEEFVAKGIIGTALIYFNQCSLETIACIDNLLCDDGNPFTSDTCNNAETCEASCSHNACIPACTTGADCRDSDPLTIDICNESGTCEGVCGNISCNPICGSDSECNDGHTQTRDVCFFPGTCFAQCSNTIVAEAEITTNSCTRKECFENNCSEEPELFCCGNGFCEQSETCSSDCENTEMEILKPLFGDYVNFGESFSIEVKADPGKNIVAEGFFGTKELFDDGKHNDAKSNDGLYANSFSAESVSEGVKQVKISSAGKSVYLNLNVVPLLETLLITNKETLVLTETLEIKGTIAKKGAPVKTTLEITAENLGQNIFRENIETDNFGNFKYSYRSLSIDPAGDWAIKVSGNDDFGNKIERITSAKFISPEENLPLAIKVLNELKNEYSAGEKFGIEIEVANNGENISGAKVTATLNGTHSFELSETESGTYSAIIMIPEKTPSGKASVVISAEKNSLKGRKIIEIAVKKFNIIIEIVNVQKETYQAGESVFFKIKAVNEMGLPIENARAMLKIEEEEIPLTFTNGLYVGSYRIVDIGTFNGIIEITDSSNNIGVKGIGINAEGYSPEYYLDHYLQAIILGVAGIIGLGFLSWHFYSRRKQKGQLSEKEEELTKKIRGIQTRYFRLGALSRQKYDELMLKYEQELESVRKELKNRKGDKK